MTLLQPMSDDLWLIDGPLVRAYGFPFQTRMAVARLRGGELWLWSPVRLTEEVQQGIRSLGDPVFAVEPNKLHHLALAEWVAAWPSLRLYAPPGLADKRRDLRFVADLADEPPPEWREEIDQVRIEGSIFMTEVIFFHRPSRTCLVGDLIQKHDEDGKSAWLRWLLKLAGAAGADGSTPRDLRLSFVHRAAAREAICRVLAWTPERLIIAHGACSMTNGTEVLRRAFSWLL
ncbi:MAG: hypothetical protein J2P50_01235 [Hyphomicrobiaceae bacterium]|nr:hypothetical protein [Hyphomicrobiaceae bacterium]